MIAIEVKEIDDSYREIMEIVDSYRGKGDI